jgi:O-antigen/teichoic acid export membrane protein
LIVIIPIAFIISRSAPNLIRYFYSGEYVSASSSLSVLVFGITLISVFILLTGVSSASGRPYLSLGLSALLLPISVGSNLILIPTYGLFGAALASTAAYGIGVLIAGALVFRKFGKCVNVLSLCRILIACFSTWIVVTGEPVSMISMVGRDLLAVLIYIVVLVFLREFTRKDIEVLKGMIKGP